MLHPFIPFVTEELWQHIPHEGEALIVTRWPVYDSGLIDEGAEEEMALVMDLIRGIRNLRAEHKVDPARVVTCQIAAGDRTGLFEEQRALFSRLANIDADSLTIASSLTASDQAASATVSGVTAYLPLAGLIDIAAERERLQKEIENLDSLIKKSSGLLKNEGFLENAPAEVVQRERDRLAEINASRQAVRERLETLS
jgi:valyl-tRNA synthetase